MYTKDEENFIILSSVEEISDAVKRALVFKCADTERQDIEKFLIKTLSYGVYNTVCNFTYFLRGGENFYIRNHIRRDVGLLLAFRRVRVFRAVNSFPRDIPCFTGCRGLRAIRQIYEKP